MKRLVAISIILIGGLGVTAAEASILGRVLSVLGGGSRSTSSQTVRQTSSTALAEQSEAQRLQQAEIIGAEMPGGNLRQQITEALPLINDVLRVASCSQNDTGWRSVSRKMMTPLNLDPYTNFRSAMSRMRYHETQLCLDVSRVYDWTAPSTNTISFKANLVSSASGEAGRQQFTLQRMQSGTWMIRTIDSVSGGG